MVVLYLFIICFANQFCFQDDVAILKYDCAIISGTIKMFKNKLPIFMQYLNIIAKWNSTFCLRGVYVFRKSLRRMISLHHPLDMQYSLRNPLNLTKSFFLYYLIYSTNFQYNQLEVRMIIYWFSDHGNEQGKIIEVYFQYPDTLHRGICCVFQPYV